MLRSRHSKRHEHTGENEPTKRKKKGAYGNEVEFEFLDLIPYRQNEYVVLLPIGDSDGQVVILQLKEIDDETEEYVGVENEFVLETVFALFKERNKDFFTFE